jgi:leucyl aminopeptidase
MNITFAKNSLPKGGTLALTVFDGGALGAMATALNKKTGGAIKAAMKAGEFTGKNGQSIEILVPKGTSIERVVLLGLGKPKDLSGNGLQNLGGRFANLYLGKVKSLSLAVDLTKDVTLSEDGVASNIGFGATLGAYRFNKYRTKLKPAQKPKLARITMLVEDVQASRAAWKPMHNLTDGVILARELCNEPANILHPVDFAERCKALTDLGVKVKVIGEKQMRDLGMGSLLGVSQGSAKEAQMVFMEWNGGNPKDKPVAFVGKGLTFDSGGISLKPGGGMEDMKGDMGGAAAVTGLLSVLAARGAKANVIGVVALVENMPDADAQRPGDIVTSMSGQTIEVINTDAEGRLVLADAIFAIVMALGHDQAGMFTNNDDLAAQLKQAGKAAGENAWRMPLNDTHRKMIDSKFADMRNSTGRPAGSSAAAAFIERFTNKTNWCHLDIAGAAFGAPYNAMCKSWGTGYGVRLLNRWVADHVEEK